MELMQTRMSQTSSWGTRMSAVVLWLDRSPEALLDAVINTLGKQSSPATVAASLLFLSLFVSGVQTKRTGHGGVSARTSLLLKNMEPSISFS